MMNRRELVAGAAGALAVGALGQKANAAEKPVRVLIWDEQQPIQKTVYPNFLGNAIADHLRSRTGQFEVNSVRLDDPEQGLAASNLDNADVLAWWGHQRHGEIKTETAKALVERVRSGKLHLLALHSAHWSKVFIEAMNARAVDDALASLSAKERKNARVKTTVPPMRLYKKTEPLTPSFTRSVGADGVTELSVILPSSVFTSVAADGKPSHVRVLAPSHPIMRGIPVNWDIPQTEVYGGPFHVPTPDVTLFEETWDNGESFPGGCLWKLGKGQVIYFRPGHETYNIFRQEHPLRFVENACKFMARGGA